MFNVFCFLLTNINFLQKIFLAQLDNNNNSINLY